MDFNGIYKNYLKLRNYRKAESEPEITGISFKYKTVQYHIIDDTMEEIKKRKEFFGDVKIYSERFSLPEFGIINDILDGEEFQYEVIVGIDSKTDRETYLEKLKEVFENIESRHGVDVLGEPYKKESDNGSISEEYYNLHKIIFYTKKTDVFPEE